MSISNLLQPNNFDIYANNVNTQNIDTVTINDFTISSRTSFYQY